MIPLDDKSQRLQFTGARLMRLAEKFDIPVFQLSRKKHSVFCDSIGILEYQIFQQDA